MASEEFLPHDGTPVSKLLPPRLTKRELFAAMAMQGFITSQQHCHMCARTESATAEIAVRHADALLARLEVDDEKTK